MSFSLGHLWEFIKTNKLIAALIFISFISSLRTILLPLFGDEVTYSKIAENIILHGKYALDGKPSTITPSLPFIIAFFYTKFSPLVGFALARLLNILFIIIGLKYLWLFLRQLSLKKEIIWVIILLTVVNNNFVAWALPLYPEAILFCFFWIFIYFISRPVIRPKDLVFILLPLVALVLTRYVYAVLGVFVLYTIYNYIKESGKKPEYRQLNKLLVYSLVCILPLLFWVKYVYNLEKEIDTGLSYFSRFKNNEIWYNIQAGLGLIRHEEVGNVNGIPAFASLFVPITGFRNWFLSVLLILVFSIGFLLKGHLKPYRILFTAIVLVMLGFVFAGTGFSRYWLLMLPGFLLGFYLFFKSMKFNERIFINSAKVVAVVYVINEIRLDFLILNNL